MALEIGTATGYSAALMATVLGAATVAGTVPNDFQVVTIDISDRWYVDDTRATGAAAAELAPDVLEHIAFLNPLTAAAVVNRFPADSLPFLLIDASHAHPWPTLDLLLCLPVLAPGATVVLDDINLAIVRPEFPDWGAHHLFYGLSVAKEEGAFDVSGVAGMGKLSVPVDKASLAHELVHLLDAHEWQRTVPEDVVRQARSVLAASLKESS